LAPSQRGAHRGYRVVTGSGPVLANCGMGMADGPMTSERSMMSALVQLPILTPARVRSAYAIAVATDALQLALGPLGWAFADEVLDVVAAVAMWRLLGFHPLLLPTFIVEFIPVIDMLPTWTGCVALVIALRKRQQTSTPPPAPGSVIDV
jgi:hypothetical protein